MPTTQLGTRKVTYTIDYNDLDRFISNHYGKPFKCVCDQEWSNYASHTISIDKETLSEWDQQKLDQFKNTGNGQFLLRTLLTDMANSGIIKTGEITIDIFW